MVRAHPESGKHQVQSSLSAPITLLSFIMNATTTTGEIEGTSHQIIP